MRIKVVGDSQVRILGPGGGSRPVVSVHHDPADALEAAMNLLLSGEQESVTVTTQQTLTATGVEKTGDE